MSEAENLPLPEYFTPSKDENISENIVIMSSTKQEIDELLARIGNLESMNTSLKSELDGKCNTASSLVKLIEERDCELEKLRVKMQARGSDILEEKLKDVINKFDEVKRQHVALAEETKVNLSGFSICDEAMAIRISEELRGYQSSGEEKKYSELLSRFLEESKERRALYDKLQEIRGNIRVFCRVRPMKPSDESLGVQSVVEFDQFNFEQLTVRAERGSKSFRFDHVFQPNATQEEVYDAASPVIASVLDGYNACIFAYGQTGTGKTYTMEGTIDERGVNYRTLQDLFASAENRGSIFKYELSVSVLEIYNEQIRDLLVPSNQNTKSLEIKMGTDGYNFVNDLSEKKVKSYGEVWALLQSGYKNRAMGSTNSNEHSSRSHCMLCIKVKSENKVNGEKMHSKLWLIDLAGSERVAKSEVEGDRLKEAQSINKSLSCLGDVIHALSNKSSHIPYRNSKLTHLLQDSLGGDGKTLMFCQISPSHNDMGETLCSLNFASRVKGVELGPSKKNIDMNEFYRYKQQAEKSRFEIKQKEEMLRKAENSMQAFEAKSKAQLATINALNEKIKELNSSVAREKKARCNAESALQEKQAQMNQLKRMAQTHESSLHLHGSNKALARRDRLAGKENVRWEYHAQAEISNASEHDGEPVSPELHASELDPDSLSITKSDTSGNHVKISSPFSSRNNDCSFDDEKYYRDAKEQIKFGISEEGGEIVGEGEGNERRRREGNWRERSTLELEGSEKLMSQHENGKINFENKMNFDSILGMSNKKKKSSRLSLSNLNNRFGQGEIPSKAHERGRRLSFAFDGRSFMSRGNVRDPPAEYASTFHDKENVDLQLSNSKTSNNALFSWRSRYGKEEMPKLEMPKSKIFNAGEGENSNSSSVPLPRRLSIRQRGGGEGRRFSVYGGSSFMGPGRMRMETVKEGGGDEEMEMRRKRRRGENENGFTASLPPLDPSSLHLATVPGSTAAAAASFATVHGSGGLGKLGKMSNKSRMPQRVKVAKGARVNKQNQAMPSKYGVRLPSPSR